jgi:hypothetical protein
MQPRDRCRDHANPTRSYAPDSPSEHTPTALEITDGRRVGPPGNVDLGAGATPGVLGFISVKTKAPGDFEVLVYNPAAAGNHLDDLQFSLVTP